MNKKNSEMISEVMPNTNSIVQLLSPTPVATEVYGNNTFTTYNMKDHISLLILNTVKIFPT